METEVKGLTENDVEKLWDELTKDKIKEVPDGAMTRAMFAEKYGLTAERAIKLLDEMYENGELIRVKSPSNRSAGYWYYPAKK